MAARNIGEREFQQMMEEGKTVLVDFWAPWCSYCRRIEAAYDKIAEEFGDRVEVVKVNIDEEPRFAEREQIEVIPTLVMYRGGQALGFVVAPESKAKIAEFVRETLGK